MQCFFCGSKLEREDYGTYPREERIEGPNAYYWCEECGFTAVWYLGRPIEVLHDPAKSNECEALEYRI